MNSESTEKPLVLIGIKKDGYAFLGRDFFFVFYTLVFALLIFLFSLGMNYLAITWILERRLGLSTSF